MYCPVCKDERLVISEKSGIEIDYCPKCRGIWLDRGELEKIIERSSHQETNSHNHSYHKEDDNRYEKNHSNHGYPKKKESFLSDLFDF